MATPIKKVSRRSGSVAPVFKSSQPATATPAPATPTTASVNPNPVISDELLITEADEQVISKRMPRIDADMALISEDSLYSDEDPLEKLRNKSTGQPIQKSVAPQPLKTASSQSNRATASVVAPATKPNHETKKLQETKPSSTAIPAKEAEKPDEETRKTLPAATARPKSGASRVSARQLPKVSSGENASASRRATSRSVRLESKPQPIPLKFKIFATVAIVLILLVIVVWKPFWKQLYIQQLDNTAASVELRKSAALKLFNGYVSDAFAIFSVRLSESDANTCATALYGMQLVAKDRINGIKPLERLVEELGKCDPGIKPLFVKTIAETCKVYQQLSRSENEAKLDVERLQIIAKTMIPLTESDQKLEIRLACVEALQELSAPGVCQQMLKLASTEKGDLRDKALRNIAATALPEAVGDLLGVIASPDKLLAEEARRGFVMVRDSAKSSALRPLLNPEKNPPEVRREIVAALGKRSKDIVVQKSMQDALRDPLADIRILALKAIPVTGMLVTQLLGNLVDDPDETVRIENANTLAVLSDEDSRQVVIEAFTKNLQGKTLEAYVRALGRRSSGTRDMKALAMIMPLLERANVENSSILEALVLLTLNGQGAKRSELRRGWSVAKWKSWYANLIQREKLTKVALDQLYDCDKQRHADKREYKRLMDLTDQGLEKLTQCKAMCQPDDPEDEKFFDTKLKSFTEMRYLFQKSQPLDLPLMQR
ncbi:MAG: hypothetical protein V1899_07055 [Planctomycetota bacterium]